MSAFDWFKRILGQKENEAAPPALPPTGLRWRWPA